MMKKIGLVLCIAFLALIAMSAVSAVVPINTIFFDDFNDNNLNGWSAGRIPGGSPSNHYGTDNAIPINSSTSYYAWLEDDVILYKSLNTTGNQSISFSYCRRTFDTGTGDFLRIGWKTGAFSLNWSTWNELESIDTNNWACVSFPLNGANNTQILIAFYLDNDNNDYGKFDNVKVTGISMNPPVSCVPIWTNGSWGECINGTQTRTVNDLNGCNVTTDKPLESQSCQIEQPQYPLPTCSVNYLEGDENYNIAAWPYVDAQGYYAAHGYASSNSAQCYLENVWFNRTSPDSRIKSWDPTGQSTFMDFYWKTNSNSDDKYFAEGNHTICCKADSRPCRDGNCQIIAGNASCTQFCIDTQDPTMDSIVDNTNDCSTDGKYWNQTSITFSWTAHDSGCAGIKQYNVKVYYSNNTPTGQEEVITDTQITLTKLVNGEDYYIRVTPVDNAGNEGNYIQSDHIYIDTEAPTVVITSPVDGFWTKDDFNVIENDTDNLGLDYCWINVNNTGWQVTTCGQQNTYFISVDPICALGNVCKNVPITKQVRDKACNMNQDSILVNIDRQAPNTTKTVSEPKYPGRNWTSWLVDWFIKDTTSLSFSADDFEGYGSVYPETTITYYTITNSTGSVVSTGNGTAVLMNLEDGIYIVTYYSKDGLGNTEVTKTEIDKIDTLAPETVKLIGNPKVLKDGKLWITSATNFTLTCSDSEVGCANTYFNFNNGDWNNGLAFNIIGVDGEYYVQYYSVDLLDNTESTKNETDWLDNTPPELYIINPTWYELVRGDCSMDLLVEVVDRGVGVNTTSISAKLLYANGSVAKLVSLPKTGSSFGIHGGSPYSALMDTTGLPAGDYTLEVQAIDLLGNMQTKTKDITLKSGAFVEYVAPSSCKVDIGVDKNCSFTFNACVRDSGSLRMWMEKLNHGKVDPFLIDATVWNNLGQNAEVGLMQDGELMFGECLPIANSTLMNGWLKFNMTMSIPANVSSLIGGKYTVNYTVSSFDNFSCEEESDA